MSAAAASTFNNYPLRGSEKKGRDYRAHYVKLEQGRTKKRWKEKNQFIMEIKKRMPIAIDNRRIHLCCTATNPKIPPCQPISEVVGDCCFFKMPRPLATGQNSELSFVLTK